jgi:ABC-type long-subunit fatty acid transport system fused permease/ATPase subunit
MKRLIEIASGIGVFTISLLSLMALIKMYFTYQQSPCKLPVVSILSLTIAAFAVLLSFVGAFILLSWGIKRQ